MKAPVVSARRLLIALVLLLVLLPLDQLRSSHAAGAPTTWTVSSTKDT
jgi:hypothetical protein